jgi:hypothetical protein
MMADLSYALAFALSVSPWDSAERSSSLCDVSRSHYLQKELIRKVQGISKSTVLEIAKTGVKWAMLLQSGYDSDKPET